MFSSSCPLAESMFQANLTRWLITVVLVGIYGGSIQSVSAEETNIEQLVTQWASTEEPSAAEAKLLTLGEPALSYLEDHLNSLPRTVRARFQQIRPKFEAQLVEQRQHGLRLVLPPRPTLADVLSASAAVGAPLESALSVEQQRTPLNVENAASNFWDVLETLARQTNGRLDWSGQGKLSLIPDSTHPILTAVTANCGRLRLTKLERLSDQTATPPGELLRIHLELDIDPVIRPLSLHWRDADWEVRRAGQQLLPFNPESARERSFVNSGRLHWELDYRLPETVNTEFEWELTGTLQLRAALRPRPIRFAADPALRTPFVRTGGHTIELLQWDTSGTAQQEVTLSVGFPEQGPEQESYRLGDLHQDVWLETEGERFLPTGLELRQTENLLHHVKYRISVAPATDQTFTYVALTLLRTVEIHTPPLRFKLPRAE
jgi:hypothetical protein